MGYIRKWGIGKYEYARENREWLVEDGVYRIWNTA